MCGLCIPVRGGPSGRPSMHNQHVFRRRGAAAKGRPYVASDRHKPLEVRNKHVRLLFVVSLTLAVITVIATTGVSARSQSPPVHSEQPSAPAASSSGSVEKQEVKSYTLSPEKYEKAVAYSRTQYRLHFLGVAYSLYTHPPLADR